MKELLFIETGAMVMLGDKAWGCEYADGHSTSYGWIDPAKVPLRDARFINTPSDITYRGSPDTAELNKGKVVIVERTVITRVLE